MPFLNTQPENKEQLRQARKLATLLGTIMIITLISAVFGFFNVEDLNKQREIVIQGQQEVFVLKENLAKCAKNSQMAAAEARLAKLEVETLKLRIKNNNK